MAEETTQEKVHDPTPRRIREYREEGRIAQSREVSSAAQLALALVAFAVLGHEALLSSLEITRWTITSAVGGGRDAPGLLSTLVSNLAVVLPSIGVLCLLMMAGAVGAGLLQTGFNWAPKALAFKWERLDLVKRLQELFDPKRLGIQLVLSVLKVTAGAVVVGAMLWAAMPEVAELALSSLGSSYALMRDLLWEMLVATVLVLAALAALDYVWQRRQLLQQMKMTHDELRRETEEQEGKPLFKQRRRQVHRELSLNRILREVPRATVVVTNPTHLAVALRYVPGEDPAPRVTAKGQDEMALHVRRVARRHGIPILEDRPLARTLWREVKVGRTVPSDLFPAVAAVLARVWRKRNARPRPPAAAR